MERRNPPHRSILGPPVCPPLTPLVPSPPPPPLLFPLHLPSPSSPHPAASSSSSSFLLSFFPLSREIALAVQDAVARHPRRKPKTPPSVVFPSGNAPLLSGGHPDHFRVCLLVQYNVEFCRHADMPRISRSSLKKICGRTMTRR